MSHRPQKQGSSETRPLSRRQLYTLLPFIVVMACAVIILSWFVQFESEDYYNEQRALAQSAGIGVAHNLSQIVAQKQQMVDSLVHHQYQLLEDLATNPQSWHSLIELENEVIQHVADSFSFTLTDDRGHPIIERQAAMISSECLHDLSRFARQSGHAKHAPVMHGSNEDNAHFDIMHKIELDGRHFIFFISFRADRVKQLLQHSMVPGLSLLVVNSANPGRIEISSAGVFKSDWHGEKLSDDVMQQLLYSQTVAGSGWTIMVLPNGDIFTAYRETLIQRSLLVFFSLLLILLFFLWRLMLEEKSRSQAELALYRSHQLLERRVAQRTQQLADNEDKLRKTFMSAPYGMLVVDDQGRIESINRLAADIFQYTQQELIGKPMEILLPQRMRREHAAMQQDFVSAPRTRFMGNGRYLTGMRKNGEEFSIEVGLSPIQSDSGTKIIASVSDVSEITRLQRKLRQQHELALVTLSSIGDGVITTDVDGIITSINPVAEKLSGWKAKDANNRHITEVFQLLNETTRKRQDNPVMTCLQRRTITDMGSQTVLVHRNGMDIPVEDSAAPIRGSDGEIIGAVLVFHDVSQSRAHANEIEYQANHDALTGLLNRREFDNRLSNAVKHAREKGSEHILLFMDLDRFKRVNDTAGHAAGDELLIQLTGLMASRLRQRDTLARLGGDEFAVLLEHCSEETGFQVANKLREAVEGFRFFWQEQVFGVGISIGMVSFSRQAESADEILSEADAACYTAKENGRNRVQVYDAFAAQKRSESSIVNMLEEAFENNRMVLYQQLIKSTDKIDATRHYEILVRMQNKQNEIMSPGMFLPAAERFGLATTLDRWVVRTAFKWLQQNAQECQHALQLAINLSGQSITDEAFAEFVHQQFTEYAIDSSCICFEITETAAMKNIGNARSFIQDLKQLGCQFALDDFGSGHASYAHLKHLPVDYLKIDGLFVQDIAHDSINLSIVKSVNDISHALGLKTIAEYVENDEIRQLLFKLGVDYLQGYGIARPAPLDELLQADQQRIQSIA